VLGSYAPAPPPGALPPVLWGDEAQVHALFGPRVESLQLTRREYVESAASPGAYLELFKRTFGPMVAIGASLADRPAQSAALERDFLEFVSRANRGKPHQPVQVPYEYLLVVGRKRR
jgi:2-polyprenyl-6-hydroxyphenyl methylase/3-demethylubiquinone-9 3-methyltransferase